MGQKIKQFNLSGMETSPTNIVCFSGGKDSTAMLHIMIDRGEKIDAILFFDTGWDFPAMESHIQLVEKNTGIKIQRLMPPKPFEYYMFEHKYTNKQTNQLQVGYGWPRPKKRWCTHFKIDAVKKYIKENYAKRDYHLCMGIAYDEPTRIKTGEKNKHERYPLYEYEITEDEALNYCYGLGYDWSGLYKNFKRVSCFCCPLHVHDNLRTLRKKYPTLWTKMLEMDNKTPFHNKQFTTGYTVADFDKRFEFEDTLTALCSSDAYPKKWSVKFREAMKGK